MTVRNSGTLTHDNEYVIGNGILVAADNRRVEIVNDGEISAPAGSGAVGIEIAYQQARYLAPFAGLRDVLLTETGSYYSRAGTPLESYSVHNTGLIATENWGIRISTNYLDPDDNLRNVALGTPNGSVVNDGTIRSRFGISLGHYGDRSVVNNGRIESFNPNAGFSGINVSAGAGDFRLVQSTVRVENSATGVIDADVDFGAFGITVSQTPSTIVNAGVIDLRAVDLNTGIYVNGSGENLGLTTIENSGTLRVEGADSAGIFATFFASSSGAVSETRLTSSGVIEATGQNSIALTFYHGDIGGDPGGAQRGRAFVDLASTSVVRGGGGMGVAVRFVAGERHELVNRGLISAVSGQAILGGSAIEIIDNSGRIEGSVVLGAGNDSVTMRAGAVQIGTLDGGADTDSLLFDIAGGEASATGAILNFESVSKTGAGTLTLRDTGTISPGISFLAGTLLAEGNLGTTAIAAPTGTTFGGSGSVGAVTIADGATISPGGAGVGTLTVASLSLSGDSRLLFDLGAPGMVGGAENDLIEVTGNLVLDGQLEVDAQLGFGPGVYRLINYGGALTDNGLLVGTAPPGDYEVQTGVAGQVNLVVAAAGPGPVPTIQFWDGSDTAPDGTIDGGSGTWGGTRTNWTRANGEVNDAWAGNFAVFQGAGGTVTIDPAGVTATGLQFASNGYTIEGGPLTLEAPAIIRVGDGSAGGSGYSAVIASAIGGTGGIEKTDLGLLSLTGTNSYSGGTTISGGVLLVSADGALGAASGGLTLNGGTFRIGGNLSTARTVTAGAGGGTIDTQAHQLTLSGLLQGTGTLAKTGTGMLILGGNSGGFGGRLDAMTGAVRLDGTLGGTLAIGAGASLSGTGTAGDLIVAGTLAPGNGIGTMNVAGNAVFRAGSAFAVEISAAGGTDRLAVSGTATIEGGTVAVTTLDPETNYTDGTAYTFLTAAGGLTGTFSGVAENSAFLDFTLGYSATTAYLTVDVVRTFPDVAQSFNQVQAATGLRDLDRTAGSDSLAVYNALLLLDSAPARAGFDLSSGEIYPVLMAATLRRGEMAGARLAARAFAGGERGLGFWAGADGHDGSVDADGNGADFDYDGRGVSFGLDWSGGGFSVGVGGGWSEGDVELPARSSAAATDSWHFGGFVGAGTGHRGFSASLSAVMIKSEAEVVRGISFGTVARTATASVDVDATVIGAELRYGLPLGTSLAFGPLVSAGWSEVDLGGFDENGANSLDLSSDGSSDDWASYGVGGFVNLRSGRGSIDASVQYVHGGGRAVEAGLSLAGAPGTPFRVRAAEGGEDAALIRIGGRLEMGGGWSIGGNLRALTGGGESALSGAATISLRF